MIEILRFCANVSILFKEAPFLERLQRAYRVYETNAPSYVRTHPLTFERIADIRVT